MKVETIGDATLYLGDCRESLRTMPDRSVQCVVTSPPYYGLRDYGNAGQIGLETTPDEYVSALVGVFREVRRVLRDDGTVWLNLGDSYAAGKAGRTDDGCSNSTSTLGPNRNGLPNNSGMGPVVYRKPQPGFKSKDLIGIPWRVAFALQADGWYLRQDIIWHKPNPMPESVTDRCTKAHEYVFLLSKSARYFYDAEAVKEVGAGRLDLGKMSRVGVRIGEEKETWTKDGTFREDASRNRRSVWTIATQPYSGAHFATFPPKLIEPCILAGTPEKGCCPHCGAPWERVVERVDVEGRKDPGGVVGMADAGMYKGRAGNASFQTTGHQPTCTCPDHEPIPSTVLDPFGGSGTTAAVALDHGRKGILCELSEEYAQLVPDRIRGITDALDQSRLFSEVV